ncbi:MAG: hypothetical protein ACRDJK_08430 [Actinomycetota bacterium]
MTPLEELRDPWGILVGVLAGVVAWALELGPAVSVGVGVGTLLLKAIVATLLGRQGKEGLPPPAPASFSAGERWLERAESAGGTALETMHRLASQVDAVDITLGQVNAAFLTEEDRRLAVELEQASDPEVRSEIERSLAAVQEQLALRAKLEQGRQTLIARMESGTLELERLVARLAQALVATGVPAPRPGRPPGAARRMSSARGQSQSGMN